MTRYLELALAGVPASADDWNEHLIAFHRAFPNVTPELIGRFRSGDDETSYQRLARHVKAQEPVATRILDLGCGSGELMDELDTVFSGEAELIGIDLVESELALARRRLHGATLIRGNAAADVGVEDVDVVVAHLSFLSMARLRDALCRVYNALRTRGLLTFIIEDPSAPDSVVAMMAPLMQALYERYPRLNFAVPERDGIENELTLRALLKSAGFTGAIDVEPLVLSAHLTRDEACEFALLSYPFGLLDETERSELRKRLCSNFARRDDTKNGTLVKLPLKLVTTRR